MIEEKLPVVILHGWSGTSGSLKPLSAFLKKSGYNVVDVWLSEYLSMNDEITINDLGQAMGKALKDKSIPTDHHSFDVIVHSTGGLVIRAYLRYYFYGQPEKCPIKHLVMLAPANFGSPFACIGKSMIGRMFKGWSWDHFLQTGTRILQALDMASPTSWALAHNDLFDKNNQVFRTRNMFTTILVGSSAYNGMAGAIHKNGTDGTVYVSTANLNAKSMRLVFSPGKMEVNELECCYDPIAFGVLYGYNHQTIITPEEDGVLTQYLSQSLSIKDETEYERHLGQLKEETKNSFEKGLNSSDEKEKSRYHQYQNVSVYVHDQFGESILDYFLEFFQDDESGRNQKHVIQKIQSEILEKVYVYEENKSYRSLLFDITDLREKILKEKQRVDMSICVAALSKRISYFDPKSYITVASPKDEKYIVPNTTLMIDIQLERQSEGIFEFIKA